MLFRFTGYRAEGGYRKQFHRPFDGDVLLPKKRPEVPSFYTSDDSDRDLYARFAAIRTDEDVIKFADEYGLLQYPEGLEKRKEPERISLWHEQARLMDWCVGLLDALNQGTDEALQPFAKDLPGPSPLSEFQVLTDAQTGHETAPVDGTVSWGILPAHTHPLLALVQSSLEGNPQASPDLRTRALGRLQAIVNGQLAKHTTARLAYLELGDLEAPVKTLALELRAKNLLGFLWTLFAASIDTKTTFRRCEGCGRWMPIRPGSGRRRHARVCSPKCQMRKWRARKEGGMS